MRICVAAVLALLLIGLPAAAANPAIAEAQELYDILDLEGSRDLLVQALAKPGNSDGDLKQIYKLLGMCYVMLDDETKAHGAFTNLLALDRGFELEPSVADQIQEVFAKVKRNLPAHLERPKPAAGAASADEFPGSTGRADDDTAALEDETGGAGDTGGGGDTSAEADLGLGDSPPAGGDSGGGDDFDLAALEAEAAATMGGEGGGGMDDGAPSDPLAGSSDSGNETFEATMAGGGGDVVKVFPPQVREVSKGSPVEMELDLEDLAQVVQRVVLYYRPEGITDGFSTVEGQQMQGTKFFVKIPWIWDLAVGDTLALEYYVEALGAGDQLLGSYGQSGAPYALRATLGKGYESNTGVAKTGSPPIYEKAWFWGLIGGVVAAGTATGLIVGLWPDEKHAPAGSMGKVTLQPR